jgi:uncharacterized membrane protein YsdA (DUF1294 family)/cold shock CspA family protein
MKHATRIKGKINHWNPDKAFGFITPESGAKEVFVHIKAFTDRSAAPAVGQLVAFSPGTDRGGRPCAVRVTLGNELPAGAIGRNDALLWSVVAGVFLLFVMLAAAGGLLPAAAPLFYIGLSVIAFAVYAWDKSAARSGAWRTEENTLQTLAQLGGWPGALIAQQVLRHKSRKAWFRLVFWVTVAVNCAALAWLCTAEGAAFLQGLISSI